MSDLMTDREQFVRDNAVPLVHDLEAKVNRQQNELARLYRSRDDLRRENARLRDEVGNAEECLSVAEHDRDCLAAACREAVTRMGHWRQTAQECRSQADDLARRRGPACTREWADLAERWRWLAEAWERLAALLPPDFPPDAPAAEGEGGEDGDS
jgi:chromosome segregation ATPase